MVCYLASVPGISSWLNWSPQDMGDTSSLIVLRGIHLRHPANIKQSEWEIKQHLTEETFWNQANLLNCGEIQRAVKLWVNLKQLMNSAREKCNMQRVVMYSCACDCHQLGPAAGSWAVVHSEIWHSLRIKDKPYSLLETSVNSEEELQMFISFTANSIFWTWPPYLFHAELEKSKGRVWIIVAIRWKSVKFHVFKGFKRIKLTGTGFQTSAARSLVRLIKYSICFPSPAVPHDSQNFTSFIRSFIFIHKICRSCVICYILI